MEKKMETTILGYNGLYKVLLARQRVEGVGFRGLGFQDLGCRASGFRVSGFGVEGFRVQGFRIGVEGLGV